MLWLSLKLQPIFFRDKKGMLEDEETMLSDQAHPTLEPTPTKSYWVNMSSECAHFCKHTMTFTTNKHSYKVCKEFIEVHDDAGSRVYMCNTLCKPQKHASWKQDAEADEDVPTNPAFAPEPQPMTVYWCVFEYSFNSRLPSRLS